MDPTSEQTDIVDAFSTGEDCVVEALAGCGKTSVLKMMAASTGREGVYVAFNKSVADEAATSFTPNTRCRTAHSIAFGAEGYKFKHRLNGPRVTSTQTVGILGIGKKGMAFGEKELKPWQVARLAMDTTLRYCYSADEEILPSHVPWTNGLEQYHDQIAGAVVELAERAWEDLTSKDGRLRFFHDVYVKLWGLSRPILNYDYILLDEAQDTNPVLARVIMDQDTQKVLVGDKNQALYGWRGAIDAMSSFEAPHHLPLSQSFRFGAAIADEANRWLDMLDAPFPIRGSEIDSKVVNLKEPDAVLCRTNAGCVARAIHSGAKGKSVAIVGGTKEIRRFAVAAGEVKAGKKTSHPDLMMFSSWPEVREYAQTREGQDLRVYVRLIDSYGIKKVMEVADANVTEADADLIVSTTHKAKGREWGSVSISEDFEQVETKPSETQFMVCYVAVTRAQHHLDLGGLSWVSEKSSSDGRVSSPDVKTEDLLEADSILG